MKRIENVLENEHREAEEKLDKILKSNNNQEKEKLFDEVSKEILEHISAEEKVYYSKIEGKADDGEIAESEQEHHIAKVLIREIRNAKVTSPEWDAKVEVLKENLEHHHEEEEEDFFEKSKENIARAEAVEMAEEFRAAK